MTVGLDDSAGTQRAVENDVTDLSFSTPRGVQDSTGVDSSANERILLLADFQGSVTGIFNDAATTGFHTVVKTVGSTSVTREVIIVHSSQTLAVETVFTDQQWSRATTGELTCTVPMALNETTVPTWS